MSTVYLDELLFYVKRIAERKIANMKTQLLIVQNPHTKDPRKLWKEIETSERNISYEKKSDTFDPVGFELLKDKLRQNPRFVVKS